MIVHKVSKILKLDNYAKLFFNATPTWELTPPPQENRPLASDKNQKCHQTCTIV